MRKLFCKNLFSILILIVVPFYGNTQIKIASWIGYNSMTDHFPIKASLSSPAVVQDAYLSYSNLKPANNLNSSWYIENNSERNTYLSFTLRLHINHISFDKFVIHGLGMDASTTAELRWSVDGFSNSLGRFKTTKDVKYSLTSVDLSQHKAITNKDIEFRVYYFDATGSIEHNDAGRNPASDNTPHSYENRYCIVSIWATDVSVLPAIEQFRGKADQGGIQLKWQTSSEQDISHFEIERSTDGINFKNIGNVTALGLPTSISKYHFTDRSVSENNKGMSLYRLWMLDNSGNATYTNTVAVFINKKKNNVLFFPNPQSNSSTIAINSPRQEIIRYSIIDSKSKKLQTARLSLQQGNNTINLQTDELAKGIYTLELSGTYTKQKVKFIR